MPYDEPEADDPQMLMGIVLPGDEAATREMAAVFADEFAQLGLDRARILALYRNPFYAGAHRALKLLGEDAIGRLIDESVGVWGRFRSVVRDSGEEAGDDGKLVRTGGFLKVLR